MKAGNPRPYVDSERSVRSEYVVEEEVEAETWVERYRDKDVVYAQVWASARRPGQRRRIVHERIEVVSTALKVYEDPAI